MNRKRQWQNLLPSPVRRWPTDLAIVVCVTMLTILVVTVPGVRETPLRLVVGVPFVLLVPGYVVVAALFPGRAPLGWIERFALAFGASIAVVPILGLLISITPWGLSVGSVLTILALAAIGGAVIAALRRWSLPADERLTVSLTNTVGEIRAQTTAAPDRRTALLNIGLGGSILFGSGMLGYAVAFPRSGETYSGFYLLTETTGGELIASGYQTEFVLGETAPFVLGIENTEGEPVEYTVVVELQAVDDAGDQITVTETDELDRMVVPLDDGETAHLDHEIAPTMVGEELRLQYLLFAGEPPSDAQREDAHSDLHLWISISRS